MAATPPPPSGSVVSLARYDGTPIIGGGGMAAFDFTNLSNYADPTPHFDLTAGGDIQINTAGIYALHLVASLFNIAANTAQEFDVAWNLTSGGPVRWSSQTGGSDEGGGFWGVNIEDLSGVDVKASGQASLFSYLYISTAATVPVVIQCSADNLVDNVSTADTLKIYCTGVRFGSADE